MLQSVLKYISKRCPNISVAHSDKDLSEINVIRVTIPRAKHQLCYWHAIKYLEERLAEDKPPARYDPRTAHQIHSFIDPTWAPGVTSGLVEEGVYNDGTEGELSAEGSSNVSEYSRGLISRLTYFI